MKQAESDDRHRVSCHNLCAGSFDDYDGRYLARLRESKERTIFAFQRETVKSLG